MKSNLEKWNYYKGLLDEKANVFMDTISLENPKIFYKVNPNGSVNECTVINRHYSFEPYLYFSGKKPTNKDVDTITALYNSEITFKPERAYFDYSYVWGIYDGKEGVSKTAINVKDVFENKTAFLLKEDAEKAAEEIKLKNDEANLFKETHKKDAGYDYKANGYKFLGWQNGWKHVYFDEDGKITTGDLSNGEKPKKTFGYTKEDYPEYGNCIELKHRRIEVQHNSRGSENTVSCPVCKIYWKYDCSD